MGFSDSVQIEHLNGRVKNLIEKIREEIGIEILILNLNKFKIYIKQTHFVTASGNRGEQRKYLSLINQNG